MKIDEAMEIVEELTNDAWTCEVDSSQLCRICANPSDHLIPIFQGEGLEHDLQNKIKKHLPIKVFKNDRLPTVLCYPCASTLIAWSDLVSVCVAAKEKFNSFSMKGEHPINKPQPVIKKDTGNLQYKYSTATQPEEIEGTNLEDEIAAMNNEVVLNATDEDGNLTIEEVKAMSPQPVEISSDPKSMSFRNYLLATCSLRNKLLQHNFEASKWLSINTPCMRIREENLQKSSEEKEDGSDSPKNIESNLDDRKGKHNCIICDRGFNRACDLKRHNSIHLNCAPKDSESQSTNYEIDGKTSQVQSKNIVLFTCEVCSRMFKVKDSLERHKRIHTGERPFPCAECSKRFRDSGALTRHVKEVHAKIRNHQCQVCNKWFVNRATLEDHHRTHTGERPYVCHYCGIMFKSKAALYQHAKTHLDELPHTCEYCSKGFRRRQELLAHTTTHTNEKNHICDKCGKGFSTRSELKRHIVVHSDEKLFVCPSCSLSFSQKRYLKSHIKSRHVSMEETSTGIVTANNLGIN